MCGIYGIAKSPKPYTSRQYQIVRKVVREIAIASESRGAHSSGIARIGANPRIYKSLLPSSKFVDTKEYNEAVKSLHNDTYILLGHTRFATEGAIIKSNAHPFRVGETIGAHNGCVYNIAEMQTTLDKQCPVDSQLIFKAIDDNDNIQDAVRDFDSDFALSFVKKNPMVLYLCRESNRPLHVAYVPQLKTLFYASEQRFIEDAFDKYGIKVEIIGLNKNTLYTYDVAKFDDVKSNVEKTEFEYESRVYQFNINNYANKWNSFDDYQYDDKYLNYWYGDLYDDCYEAPLDADEFAEWEDEQKNMLCLDFGGRPSSWWFDKSECEWYHWSQTTNEILTLPQIIQKWEDNGVSFDLDDNNEQLLLEENYESKR
jgi:amidophosphoribosyltransferase